MFWSMEDLLSEREVHWARSQFETMDFQDGRATAGIEGRSKKANQEARPEAALQSALNEAVWSALMKRPEYRSGFFGRRMTPVLASRYGVGDHYADHVDTPIQRTPNGLFRKDLSFTVFLDDPDAYQGGELVVEGCSRIKLSAGSAVVYPASTLHRVEPVLSGCRRVLIGWIEAGVRDPRHMGILSDLHRARVLLNGQPEDHGDEIKALLARSYCRLAQEWTEV